MKKTYILLGEIAACFILAGGVFVLVWQGNSEMPYEEASLEVQKENLMAMLQTEEQPIKSVASPTPLPTGQIKPKSFSVLPRPAVPTPLPSPILATPTPVSSPSPTPVFMVSPSPSPAVIQSAPSPFIATATPPPVIEVEPSFAPVLISTPTPIPTPLPSVKAQMSSSPDDSLININTAGKEELEEITGVGPVIAQRIIDYRNANGPFQVLEDLKKVKGIGDKTFLKMKDEIAL